MLFSCPRQLYRFTYQISTLIFLLSHVTMIQTICVGELSPQVMRP